MESILIAIVEHLKSYYKNRGQNHKHSQLILADTIYELVGQLQDHYTSSVAKYAEYVLQRDCLGDAELLELDNMLAVDLYIEKTPLDSLRHHLKDVMDKDKTVYDGPLLAFLADVTRFAMWELYPQVIGEFMTSLREDIRSVRDNSALNDTKEMIQRAIKYRFGLISAMHAKVHLSYRHLKEHVSK